MKTLKNLLITAAAVAVLGASGAYVFATRLPSSPFDVADIPDATGDDGRYTARLGDCVACHTTEGGEPFAGGLEMGTPLGSVFTTNITPDPETGIGSYTLADFDRAVRHGVALDGHRLYPAMPYPSYAALTDEDVAALYAYFMQEVQPVRQENTPSSIPAPLNQRWPLAFWNLAFAPAESFTPDPAQSEDWNRGAYLVEGPGHCGACHTPRGLAMQEVSLNSDSPDFLSGAVLDGWYAPSLRQDHNTGLGRWSEQDIVAYLRDGRNVHGTVFGPMQEAFNNSTSFMNGDDLRGIAVYLKSLPGDADQDGAPWEHDGTLAALDPGAGAQTYMQRCASCHMADGTGRGIWMPPLAGASSLLADDPTSAINITLNGGARVVAQGIPDSYRMPAFRDQLSDEEIAQVVSFLRGAWGHEREAVSANDVSELRRRTDAASSDVIVLQMR